MDLPWTMIRAGGNPVPDSILEIGWAEDRKTEIEVVKKTDLENGTHPP